MNEALDLVRKARRKNKIEREIEDNENKIRDNRKRVELLTNLMEYVDPSISFEDFIKIVETMKADYEERVSDHIILNADLQREKLDIMDDLKTFEKF